jgi:thymidylate synthase (FAD)
MSSVSLIWSTPNAEALITKMARVSNPANADNLETAPRLLRYLIRHRHWSPFEMASMCVKVDTERDISAQILRHRSFSFQEFSTRYAEAQPYTIPALRRQDTVNRQNSFDDLDPDTVDMYQRWIDEALGGVSALYGEMLAEGVAKETARRILPLCTRTTLYMAGTLRSWVTFIALREKPDTQFEHREIALAAKELFCAEFPSIADALGGMDGAWAEVTGQ